MLTDPPCDVADHEQSGEVEHERDGEDRAPGRGREQCFHARRVEYRKPGQCEQREKRHDECREPCLRSLCTHVRLDARALVERAGEAAQQLGEVAAAATRECQRGSEHVRRCRVTEAGGEHGAWFTAILEITRGVVERGRERWRRSDCRGPHCRLDRATGSNLRREPASGCRERCASAGLLALGLHAASDRHDRVAVDARRQDGSRERGHREQKRRRAHVRLARSAARSTRRQPRSPSGSTPAICSRQRLPSR